MNATNHAIVQTLVSINWSILSVCVVSQATVLLFSAVTVQIKHIGIAPFFKYTLCFHL